MVWISILALRLGIADDMAFMQPALIELLIVKAGPYLRRAAGG